MTKSLHYDERGAIMLVALAFAVFGVAMLYYAVGIGQTVLLREHLQDAADTTALTTAVVHARSMNFIVLLNIIMAALLAILVGLKLAETLATIGIIIAAALAWVTGGSTLSAIPPLKSVQEDMKDLYDTAKDPIFEALEILHKTASVVADITPKTARGVANSDLEANWEKSKKDKHLVTIREEHLPVEDDTFDRLCDEAGKTVGTIALKPLSPIIPDKVEDALKDGLGELTGSMSDWFCSDSGGPPPTPPPQHVKNRYPRTQGLEECQGRTIEQVARGAAKRDPSSVHTPACDESDADYNAAEPDHETGACKRGDCSSSGPYSRHADQARQQCDPTTSPTPFFYSYQRRAATVTYRYDRKLGWVRGEPEYARPTYVAEQLGPPCGPRSVSPSVAVGYQAQARDERGARQPLCSDEEAPVFPPLRSTDPTEQVVKFTEVTEIFSCMKSEDEPVKTSGGTGADSSGEKYPKRLRGDLKLGSESFQTRVFVRPEQTRPAADRIVKLALWNAKSPAAELPPGHELQAFGFAQAEYFYDGTEPADEWMWNMKWRARLVHFRVPEQTEDRAKLWEDAFIAFGAEHGSDLETGIKLVETEIAH